MPGKSSFRRPTRTRGGCGSGRIFGWPEKRIWRRFQAMLAAERVKSLEIHWWYSFASSPEPRRRAMKAELTRDARRATKLVNDFFDHAQLCQKKNNSVKSQKSRLRRSGANIFTEGMRKSAPYLVGERLRKIREAHGLNQSQLARLFEIERGRIHAWERGKARPKPEEVYLYIVHFRVTADWVYFGSDETLHLEAGKKLGIL